MRPALSSNPDSAAVRAGPRRPLAAAAALLLAGAAASSTAGADGTVLAPDSLRVVRGSTSDTGLAALGAADQRGTADDWSRYVELAPGARGFLGVFEFELPVELLGGALESLSVGTSFRGPERREQPWRWHVRDHRARRWTPVGDNGGVPDWRWTARDLAVPGAASDHVDALGRVRVRMFSPSSHDVADLDALTLTVGTAVTAEPAPTPVPTPASTPVPAPAPTSPVAVGGGDGDGDGDGGIWRPSPGTSWQWQLTGEIDTSIDVDMYDIDLFDTPTSVIDELHADGRVVICYFSAGSREDWRPDAGDFPAEVLGRPLDGWPGERWLDVRALDALRPIMIARMNLAAAKGCDGVEPDNVDAFDNPSGFPLSGADQIAYNVALAEAAHERGLSIGLKNDLAQVPVLEPYFDWALNEQCVEYEECGALSPFVEAGKAVFGVEYRGELARFCGTTNALDFDWLKKPLALGAAREACR